MKHTLALTLLTYMLLGSTVQLEFRFAAPPSAQESIEGNLMTPLPPLACAGQEQTSATHSVAEQKTACPTDRCLASNDDEGTQPEEIALTVKAPEVKSTSTFASLQNTWSTLIPFATFTAWQPTGEGRPVFSYLQSTVVLRV